MELSALLHDVGDHKFHKEKDAAEKLISEMLDNAGVSEELKNQVLEIVSNVSYKGANVETSTNHPWKGRLCKMQIAWMQLEQ